MSDEIPTHTSPPGVVLPPTLQELGLPASRVVQLLCNRKAGKIIVELEMDGMPPRHTLYWRNLGESRYQLLDEPGANSSQENAIACGAPWLFARAVQWVLREGRYAGGTSSLLRIALDGVPTVSAVDVSDILPSNARISRLLRANDSGTSVQSVVILRDQVQPGRLRARYAVCEIDLENRCLTELDAIPGIHF